MNGSMSNSYKKWKSIYMNTPSWAKTKKGSLGNNKEVDRLLLNMAKEACKELSNLVWSENPVINVSSENSNDQLYLDSVLDGNKFWDNMDSYIEYMAALGGFMLKVYENNGRVMLNFVLPDFFDITEEENGIVRGAKFYSKVKQGKKEYVKVEEHGFTYDEAGIEVYEIKNYLLEGTKVYSVDYTDATRGFNNVTRYYGLTNPLFVYFKTPEANNICFDSPYGISLFANAIPTLEAIDIKYDSLNDEIMLARMKVFVPAEYINTIVDENGNSVKKFDMFNRTYEAFDMGDSEDRITVFNPNIRSEEIIKGLNKDLETYAGKVGFSPGAFTYDTKGLKTATEVIADNNKTYDTVKKFRNAIDTGIRELVNTIFEFSSKELDYNYKQFGISVVWSDSLFSDDNEKLDRDIKLLSNGLISKQTIMKKLGMSDEEIVKELELIKSESNV